MMRRLFLVASALLATACGNVNPVGSYVLLATWPDSGCGEGAGQNSFPFTIARAQRGDTNIDASGKYVVTRGDLPTLTSNVVCDGDCHVTFSYAMGRSTTTVDLHIGDTDAVEGSGTANLSDVTTCPYQVTITGARADTVDD